MKPGDVVKLACKPRELVVAGSNPTPASIILAVYRYQNRRDNVEKISAISKSFQKNGSNLPLNLHLLIETISHRLTASIVPILEWTLLHGVDIF